MRPVSKGGHVLEPETLLSNAVQCLKSRKVAKEGGELGEGSGRQRDRGPREIHPRGDRDEGRKAAMNGGEPEGKEHFVKQLAHEDMN